MPVKKNNKIPKLIWQTVKSTPHHESLKLLETWDSLNPNYQRICMDDKRCDSFIKDNFSKDFYKMYTSLPMGVMRADVWRVAVVYIYGGIYADIDCECTKPLEEWISDNSLIVAVESDKGELANFFFAATPKHPALMFVLNKFMEIYSDTNFEEQIRITIQNFGQYGFSQGILDYYKLTDGKDYNSSTLVKKDNAKFFTKDEKRITNGKTDTSYIIHWVASENWRGYNSWKKEQKRVFKNPSEPKPIKFITTFSKTGYEIYGKTWINTFLKNVNDTSITADIYIDFPLDEQDRINFIDFDKAIPAYKQWAYEFIKTFPGSEYNKSMGIRFSYKAFVMMHALDSNPGSYVIWLDGDCVYKSNQEYSSIVDLLDGKAIAVQREHNNGNDHCESGIVIFDPDHADLKVFLNQFINNYRIKNLNNMVAPFDGFIIFKSLDGIEYVDLNINSEFKGIQSDPNKTFLHPELKKRFVHNIGPQGKTAYASWKNFKDSDPIFNMISGQIRTEEQEQKVLDQLLAIREKLR